MTNIMQTSRVLVWIERGGVPVECADFQAWAEWMACEREHVGDTMVGPARVSTIFMGVGVHGWLYETALFGPGQVGGPVTRYRTRADALIGHGEHVERLKAME
jgi:hypothetical protein